MEGGEQKENQQKQEIQEPSKEFISIENDLKQLFFYIIDLNEEQKDILQNYMSKGKKQNSEEEQKNEDVVEIDENNKDIQKIITEILLCERYYEIVSEFAKIWGQVDKQNPVIPEKILAGTDVVCEYITQTIPVNLQKDYNKELKQQILEDFKINVPITQEEIAYYFKTCKNSKPTDRLSDLDKEENWDNLSNPDDDDDVLYLNKGQQGQFQIDDEEDEGEIYQPPEEDEEGNQGEGSQDDEEIDMKNRDKEDFSIYQLHQHKSFVTRLALHPNEQIMVSGGGDDVALAWDLEKKDLIEIVSQKTETIDTVAFNFDGTLLATGTLDGQLEIYDYKDNKFKLKQKLEGISEEITFIEWHKKGNAIIAGGFDNTAHMWNGTKGELVQSFYGHEDVINFGCFSPDGTQVITASADKTVRIWNPKTGTETRKLMGNKFHSDSINTISFSQNNQNLMATGGEDKTACLSNIQNGKILGRTPEHEGIVDCVIFVKNQEWFITGSGAGEIRIYEIATIKLRNTVEVSGAVTKIIEIPNTYNIIASTNEGRIYQFDYRNPQQNIKILKGAGQPIHDIILRKNGLYAACEDGCIRYHDFSKFELLTVNKIEKV